MLITLCAKTHFYFKKNLPEDLSSHACLTAPTSTMYKPIICTGMRFLPCSVHFYFPTTHLTAKLEAPSRISQHGSKHRVQSLRALNSTVLCLVVLQKRGDNTATAVNSLGLRIGCSILIKQALVL